MNKLQQDIYDIFEKVSKHLEENNFGYHIYYGTLLGATRHKGYIPWDDDVDIVMRRSDLMELEKNFADSDMYRDGFRIQSRRHQKFKAEDSTRIRNSNIKVKEDQSSTQEGNVGPWIDIFPFDNIPDDITLREKQYKKIMKYNKIIKLFLLVKVNDSDKGSKRIIKSMVQFLNEKLYKINFVLPYLFNKREKIMTMYNNEDTKCCADLVYLYSDTIHNYEKTIMENETRDEFTLLKFESGLYRAPVNYEQVLTRLYGDYMKLPSEEDRVTHQIVSVE